MTRTEYNEKVTELATEIRKDAEGNHERECDLTHERVDSHVTYTSDCLDILNFSSNDSAYFDDFGALEATGFTEAVQKMAYAALSRNVGEALSNLPDYEDPDDSEEDDSEE